MSTLAQPPFPNSVRPDHRPPEANRVKILPSRFTAATLTRPLGAIAMASPPVPPGQLGSA